MGFGGPLGLDVRGPPDLVVVDEWAELNYRITKGDDHPAHTLYAPADLTRLRDRQRGLDHVATEWYTAGGWVPADGEAEKSGHFGTTGPLAPGQSAQARMPSKVTEEAPEDTTGLAIRSGVPARDGVCGMSANDHEFAVQTLHDR